MVKLNKLIIMLAETLINNKYSLKKISQKHVDQIHEKIKAITRYLVVRYPNFSDILEHHVSQTFLEYSKIYTGYWKFLVMPEVKRLRVSKRKMDNSLLNHFCFRVYNYGRQKARMVLRSVTTGTPTIRNELKSYQKHINSLQNELNMKFPDQKEYFATLMTELGNIAQESEEVVIEKLFRPSYANLDDKAIVNLTDIVLPFDIQLVLSFGPKFVFPIHDKLHNLICFLDDFCHHLNSSFPIETQMEAFKQLSIELKLEQGRSRQERDIWLRFLQYRITSFKKAHPDICIARSDKGKHTVLIHKSDYISKMDQLVRLTDDYLEVENLDILQLEQTNNDFVSQLISVSTMSKIMPDSCTLIAQMYGLIKIHKKGYPVRPITSACAAPGFKLAKIFTEILTNVFPEDGYHIRNSVQFVKKLALIQLDQYETMISFDVVSMFTNIPIDHMICLIRKRADIIFSLYKIPFLLFKKIFLFLLKDCAVFAWNEKVYQQQDSLAMGSPLSPILAKILMTDIIDSILPLLPIKPKFLALYVDDSFWIVKSYHVNLILHRLNQYHERINFTVEKKNNNRIAFLDVVVYADRNTTPGSIYTNWYKKPYASSRLLSYFSSHERTCILETAKAYIKMVQKLSDGRFFLSNKSILEDILRRNSFPETEIMALLHGSYTLMRPIIATERFAGKYVPIKYRGNFTQRLKNKIHSFLFNARLVGTPDRTDTKHFSQLKGKVDIADKTNMVLFFLCQCSRQLILRHTEFRGTAGKLIESIKTSSSEECGSLGHVFSAVKGLRCNNFSSTIRTYNMYAYAHRNILVNTKFRMPDRDISKAINLYKKQ